MSIHALEPGTFTPERIQEIAALGQRDPVVRGYRSFHSLAEGRIVWLLDAPSKEAVIAWCAKVGLPLEGVTEMEMEGFVGNIRRVRHSIPNQVAAQVERVDADGTLALVTVRLKDTGARLIALLDAEERQILGLEPGADVLVLFRATNLSLAKDFHEADKMKLSFPNQIKGRVTNLIAGPTLIIVHIDTPGGQIVSAIIPSAAEQIELKVGDEVVALFKALDVSLAKG